jgi:cell division protein ZapA
MEKLAIKVIIAGRPYKLTIDKNDEELVRNAAKMIETKMIDYAKEYAFKDQQDLLAMLALQFATSTVNYEKDSGFIDHQLRNRLVEIEQMITETLN